MADDNTTADPAEETTDLNENKVAEAEPHPSTDATEEFYAGLANEPEDADLDFSDVDKGLEPGQAGDEQPPSEQPPQQAEPEPAPTEPPEKAAKEPVEPEPEAKPGTEAKAEPPPQEPVEEPAAPEPAEEPAPQVLSPEEIMAHNAERRAEAENVLAEKHYAMSDEDLEAYEQDPRAYLPKAAARIYMDATTNTLAHVMQLFPQMVEATLKSRDSSARHEASFYETWPQLKEHDKTVRDLATVYRSQFPNAKPEEVIQNVGAQAIVALRLQPPGTQPAAPPPAAVPHKPAASSAPAAGALPGGNFYEDLAGEEMRETYIDDT